LEGIFRRIERVIEGSGAKRMALDLGPWTANKLGKKLLKWALWLVASFLTAHIFLSYFFSIPDVVTMVLDAPTTHWSVFLVAAFATGVTYFNFAWFREQTCLIVCPYGRLQSAIHDADSVTIGYDRKRGEPRGKLNSVVDGVPAGDCVDCRRCVQVCPTGIDIRNGLQMECIACGACVDACDDVMRKLHRPEGLVRYDSERGFAGEPRRRFRPRIAAYLGVGVVGVVVAATFALTSGSLAVRVTRPTGAPFVIADRTSSIVIVQNTLLVHVENRATADAVVHVVVDAADGVEVIAPIPTMRLRSQDRIDLPLLVRVTSTNDGVDVDGRALRVTVHNDSDDSDTIVMARLLGPRGP
ncbi:MAG TPA: 4Fe-4S dicluster domain-containing protein, partial [Myxococcota bacterium]